LAEQIPVNEQMLRLILLLINTDVASLWEKKNTQIAHMRYAFEVRSA
jgi:hypothetical protein